MGQICEGGWLQHRSLEFWQPLTLPESSALLLVAFENRTD